MNFEANKPVVKYSKERGAQIGVGGSAFVYGLDHPHLGEGYVSTSEVLSYDSNTGEFETLNTRYVPA